ncbi:MAG TPA: sulfurtransferase TusA family protein [Kofleriaceae bacterium]|nr:sulfurtransferase TusA family protein [Kofleriaceae bacterium]
MSSSSPSPSPPTSSSPGDGADAPAPDATADLSGEICPYTFVRTKLALEALPMGGVLRVVVDHAPAARNIPRSAAEWGQEVLAVRALDGGRFAIDLRRRVR